jgi:hypothetical protein
MMTWQRALLLLEVRCKQNDSYDMQKRFSARKFQRETKPLLRIDGSHWNNTELRVLFRRAFRHYDMTLEAQNEETAGMIIAQTPWPVCHSYSGTN